MQRQTEITLSLNLCSSCSQFLYNCSDSTWVPTIRTKEFGAQSWKLPLEVDLNSFFPDFKKKKVKNKTEKKHFHLMNFQFKNFLHIWPWYHWGNQKNFSLSNLKTEAERMTSFARTLIGCFFTQATIQPAKVTSFAFVLPLLLLFLVSLRFAPQLLSFA